MHTMITRNKRPPKHFLICPDVVAEEEDAPSFYNERHPYHHDFSMRNLPQKRHQTTPNLVKNKDTYDPLWSGSVAYIKRNLRC